MDSSGQPSDQAPCLRLNNQTTGYARNPPLGKAFLAPETRNPISAKACLAPKTRNPRPFLSDEKERGRANASLERFAQNASNPFNQRRRLRKTRLMRMVRESTPGKRVSGARDAESAEGKGLSGARNAESAKKTVTRAKEKAPPDVQDGAFAGVRGFSYSRSSLHSSCTCSKSLSER
jgi:hypothetical protein